MSTEVSGNSAGSRAAGASVRTRVAAASLLDARRIIVRSSATSASLYFLGELSGKIGRSRLPDRANRGVMLTLCSPSSAPRIAPTGQKRTSTADRAAESVENDPEPTSWLNFVVAC